MFSNQGQDNEIQSDRQGPKQRSLVISARVPFATYRSNLSSALVYCWVHSHTGFESVTSSKKVSCTVFALLSCEPVTLSKKVSCSRIDGVWARYFINESFIQRLHIVGVWDRHFHDKSFMQHLCIVGVWACNFKKSNQARQVYSYISVGCCIRLEQQCFILRRPYFSWLLHLSIGHQKPFQILDTTNTSQAVSSIW